MHTHYVGEMDKKFDYLDKYYKNKFFTLSSNVRKKKEKKRWNNMYVQIFKINNRYRH